MNDNDITSDSRLPVTQHRDRLVRQKIVDLYFDFSGGKRRTYEEIANELGIDRRTVWYQLSKLTEEDLKDIVPIWAINVAVQEHLQSEIPALINKATDIALGRQRSNAPTQLKAIELLLRLAGVSPESVNKQTKEAQGQGAISISVNIGGTPAPVVLESDDYSFD